MKNISLNICLLYTSACSNGWKMTIKELYNTVKDYGITYEDIFTFERYEMCIRDSY